MKRDLSLRFNHCIKFIDIHFLVLNNRTSIQSCKLLYTAEDINCGPALNFFYPLGSNGNVYVREQGSFQEVCRKYKGMEPIWNSVTQECQGKIDKFSTDAGYISESPLLSPVFCQRKYYFEGNLFS